MVRARAHLHRKRLRLYSAIFLAISPVLSFGQAPPQSSQPRDASSSPFAAIDRELALRAEATLTSGTQQGLIPSSAAETRSPRSELEPAGTDYGKSMLPGRTSRQERLEQLKPIVTPILEGQGVPRELVAVISVESSGIPTALSPKGARGIWQLMPDTARRYGLVVDGSRDERLDIGKSSWAAARYLSDLHAQFGSWPLALAAYNTGEQNLQRALERSHGANFPVLSALGLLPLETREYVPSVLAAWKAESRGSSAPDRQFLGSGAGFRAWRRDRFREPD